FLGWNLTGAARFIGAIALGGLIGTVIRVVIDQSWPRPATRDFRQWIDLSWIIVWLSIVVVAGYAVPRRRLSPDGSAASSRHRIVLALGAAIVIAGAAVGYAYRLSNVEQSTAW